MKVSDPGGPKAPWGGVLGGGALLWILQFLLPKTPLVISGCLIFAFLLIVVSSWNLPWLKSKGWRQACVVLLLSIVVSAFGYSIWPKTAMYAYPWIETASFLDENGAIKSILPHVSVRHHPQSSEEKDGFLPPTSLDHVHLEITTPAAVDSDRDGWTRCPLVDWNKEELNSGNPVPLGELKLSRDVTLLLVRGSSHSATWEGTVLVDRRTGNIDKSMSVTVAEGSERIRFTVGEVTTGGKPKWEEDAIAPKFDRVALIKLGVPRIRGTQVNCSTLFPN
jgi:hypothetical protein